MYLMTASTYYLKISQDTLWAGTPIGLFESASEKYVRLCNTDKASKAWHEDDEQRQD